MCVQAAIRTRFSMKQTFWAFCDLALQLVCVCTTANYTSLWLFSSQTKFWMNLMTSVSVLFCVLCGCELWCGRKRLTFAQYTWKKSKNLYKFFFSVQKNIQYTKIVWFCPWCWEKKSEPCRSTNRGRRCWSFQVQDKSPITLQLHGSNNHVSVYWR